MARQARFLEFEFPHPDFPHPEFPQSVFSHKVDMELCKPKAYSMAANTLNQIEEMCQCYGWNASEVIRIAVQELYHRHKDVEQEGAEEGLTK